MNWTGGRLQQSRRPKGGVSAQQKTYFAKARAKLYNGDRSRPPIDLSLFGSVVTDQKHTRLASIPASESEDASKYCSAKQKASWGPRKLSPATLKGFPEKYSSENEAQENTCRKHGAKRPAAFLMAQTSKKMKLEPSPSRGKREENYLHNESISIEHKRQELLKRRDWLSSGRVQSLPIQIPVERKQRKVARRRKLTEDDLIRLGQQRRERPKQGLNASGPSPCHLYPHHDTISIRHGTQIHGSQMTQLQVPLPEKELFSHPIVRSEEMLLDSSPESTRLRVSRVCEPQRSTLGCSSILPPTHGDGLIVKQEDQDLPPRHHHNAQSSFPPFQTQSWDNKIAQAVHLEHSPISSRKGRSTSQSEPTTQDTFIKRQSHCSKANVPTREEALAVPLLSERIDRSASIQLPSPTFAGQEWHERCNNTGARNRLDFTDIEEQHNGKAAEEWTLGDRIADDAISDAKPQDQLILPGRVKERHYGLNLVKDDNTSTAGEIKAEYGARPTSVGIREQSSAPELQVIAIRHGTQTEKPSTLRGPSPQAQSLDEQNEAWYKFIFGDLVSCKPITNQEKRSDPNFANPWASESSPFPLLPRASLSSTTSPPKSMAVQVPSSPLKTASRESDARATLLSPTLKSEAGSSTVDSVVLLPVSESDNSIQSNQAVKGTQSENNIIKTRKRDESQERFGIYERAPGTAARRKESVVFTKPARYEGIDSTCGVAGSSASKQSKRNTNYVTEGKIGRRSEVKRRKRGVAAKGNREYASNAASGLRAASNLKGGRSREARRNENREDEEEIKD
ncbi:hypothetical protein MMC10_004238 [Thelotrema lepadinum]|nr:hypothetical protein [Thelotrema lepadinum]